MKKILLPVFAAAILLSACKGDKKDSLDSDKQIVFSDTSALRQGNASTDVPAMMPETPVAGPVQQNPKPQVRTITKVVKVYEKQPARTPVVATPPVEETVPVAQTPADGTMPSTTTGTDVATTPIPAPEEKKKGWSGAAKGATIGGVGGAAAGAIIGKGAKGAVIGGVIGAAGGYILGRQTDKKNGRVDTTNN